MFRNPLQTPKSSWILLNKEAPSKKAPPVVHSSIHLNVYFAESTESPTDKEKSEDEKDENTEPPTDKEKPENDKDKPKVNYESVVSVTFDGQLISTVKCLTCQHLSHTQETFQVSWLAGFVCRQS